MGCAQVRDMNQDANMRYLCWKPQKRSNIEDGAHCCKTLHTVAELPPSCLVLQGG